MQYDRGQLFMAVKGRVTVSALLTSTTTSRTLHLLALRSSMLSPGVVTVLLLGVAGAAVWARFSWRSLFVSAGVLEVLGLILLGLPGAAFLETLEPLMQRLGRGPISGDGAWPAAIAMSALWPVALAPAYLVARSVRVGYPQRGLVALGVLVVLCVSIAALVYGIATSS